MSGTPISLDAPSPMFQWAPQRAIFPDSTRRLLPGSGRGIHELPRDRLHLRGSGAPEHARAEPPSRSPPTARRRCFASPDFQVAVVANGRRYSPADAFGARDHPRRWDGLAVDRRGLLFGGRLPAVRGLDRAVRRAPRCGAPAGETLGVGLDVRAAGAGRLVGGHRRRAAGARSPRSRPGSRSPSAWPQSAGGGCGPGRGSHLRR